MEYLSIMQSVFENRKCSIPMPSLPFLINTMLNRNDSLPIVTMAHVYNVFRERSIASLDIRPPLLVFKLLNFRTNNKGIAQSHGQFPLFLSYINPFSFCKRLNRFFVNFCKANSVVFRDRRCFFSFNCGYPLIHRHW